MPPAYILPPTPIPPKTCKAPVDVDVDSVVFVIWTIPLKIELPLWFKLPFIFASPPTFISPPIPTPPITCKAPVDVED